VSELSANDAGVAMRPGHLAPDDTDSRALNLPLCPVNESDLLAKVEVGSSNIINTLNLDQACVGVGVALSTLVAQVAALDIESVTLFRRHLDGWCIYL